MMLGLCVVVAAAVASAPSGTVLHVAPSGSDRPPGPASRPLATLVGARDAIRAHRRSLGRIGPVTVLVRGRRSLCRRCPGRYVAQAPRPGFPDPPVGFIWHYPFVDVGTEQIPASGATCMAARAHWAALEPTPGRYDFSHIDRQLALARSGGYRLMLILECNPFCAPKWVVDEVGSAGELVVDPLGRTIGQGPHGGVPRAHSARFLALQNAFLRACVGHVKRVDADRTITHYFPGIEWWFPPSFRYAPADVDRFRAWARRRYGARSRLNAAWSARYRRWADVAPPRLDVAELFARGRGGLVAPTRVGTGPREAGPGAVADWEAFWQQTASEVISDLAARVKQLDPSRRTASFLTLSFAASSEWDYSQWGAIGIDDVARTRRGIDDLGMQLVLCDGDPFRITAGLDLARKYGKPPMVLDLLDFARGVAIGPKAMRRASLAAVQHGARGLVYCCWHGAKDFNFHPDWPADELRGMLMESRAALRFTEGLRPVAEAALVLPRHALWPGITAEQMNRPLSFMGLYKLLESAHLPVDVLTIEDVGRGELLPSRYRWAFLPDCPTMSERARARIAGYAAGGGRLVRAGRPPAFVPSGVARDLSIRWTAEMPDLGQELAGDLRRDNWAGDTPPMFVWGADTRERADVRARFARAWDDLLGRHGAGPAVRLTGPADQVTLAVMTGRANAALFLVNRGDRPAAGVLVRVRCSRRSLTCSAVADMAESPASVRRDGPDVAIALPTFTRSCIVRLGGWRPERRP